MYTCIFDWKRTLYDPDRKTLINGSEELLQFLKGKGVKLVLVGKGDEDMHTEVDRLNIRSFFADVVFKEGAKDESLFKPFMEPEPQNTLFIGDRVRSELAAGNKLNATTIWVKAGKFAKEEPEDESQKPTYTVESLLEIIPLLEKNFSL